jgi:RNA recognition motif-containing protein
MSVNTSQVQVPRLYMSPPMQASQSFGWHGSPNMYPNMPYGLHGPAMVSMGSYNGASPNQVMDYRHVHRSPSMSPTSSPLHGTSWSQSPEQRAHVNGRTVLRAGETNKKHGQPEGTTAAVVSGPERLSRSASNSTSNGSTLNTVSSYANASPGGTSMTSDRPPTSNSMVLKTVDRLSPVAFELVNTPVIPEATKPTDPCNLFIKNLDDVVVSTSEDLKKLFEPYGTVASTHLATYNESKISKGFGFVAFTKPEDAAKAKERVNNTLVGRKRVFVSYAERKDDRAKRLKSIFRGNSDEEAVETVTKQTSELEMHDQAVVSLENTQTKENVPISEKVTGSISAGDQEDKSITESQEDHLSNLGMANSQDKHAVQDQSGRFLQKTTSGTNTAIAATLASGKGWRSTQLPGSMLTTLSREGYLLTMLVAEVEEEDVLLHATETKATTTTQPKTKVPEDKAIASSVPPVVQEVASVQPKPPCPGIDGAIKKEGQQGEKPNTRGRRNHHISKRAVSQQESSTATQGEIVNKARNVNSTNRSSSSRIPVQTKDGGTNNAPAGPRAAVQGPGQSSSANAPYQQKKQRGWNKMRGDRSGRSFDNKNVADGGGSSQKAKGNKHVEQREVENSVAGQVTVTVAAH